MLHLVVVSLIWAFSFGLISRYLAGVDAALVSAVRLGLALLVFLPFLRPRAVPWRVGLGLFAIGTVQFGVMYLLYLQSFRYLQAHEAALFTITTPIFVTLFADLLERRFRWIALAAAALAVVGVLPITLGARELSPTLTGLLLVQASNAAFGLGQVLYRAVRQRVDVRDREVFALPYAGGFAIAGLLLLSRDVSFALDGRQLLTLLYLGVLASGLGFFLWNVGATRVSAGTLAVMNNAKVPLGVAVSLLVFGGQANLGRLILSLAVLGVAVWLSQLSGTPAKRPPA